MPCHQCNGTEKQRQFGCTGCNRKGHVICPSCVGGSITVASLGVIRCNVCSNKQTIPCYKYNSNGSEMGICYFCKGTGH